MIDREQLKAVLWLRWRLTRNQWRRGGNLGAVLAAIVTGMAILGGVVLLSTAVLVGIFAARTWSPMALLAAWDVVIGFFLFSWMTGLMTELQRSETIDLQRLMHLPAALGQLFVINYIASHLVFSVLICVPMIMGFSVGLAISRGPAMLLVLPAALSMILMITAWTYCLRGWLSSLMSNPRRRRAVIFGITMFMVLLAQLPNLYFQLKERPRRERAQTSAEDAAQRREARQERKRQEERTALAIHRYVPPLWVPLSAKALAEGRAWPAFATTVGCLGLGALGLRRAYRSTLRFYRGEQKSTLQERKPRPADRPQASPTSIRMVERRLPGVPEHASAVALATLRSMLRAPEVKMTWGAGLLVSIVLASALLFRGAGKIPPAAQTLMVMTVLSMPLFLLVQLFGNQFGFDRSGFRAFLLAPVNRRDLLLGKNLANLPAALLLGLLIGTTAAVWLKLPLMVCATLALQFLAAVALITILGNLLSILVPHRVQQGSMKATKLPLKVAVVMFLAQMLFPIALLPAFLPAVAQLLWDLGKLPAFPVGLVLAMLVAGAASFAYWLTLPPLSRLLQQRELKILEVLSSDVE